MKKTTSKTKKSRPLAKHNVGSSGKKKLIKKIKEFDESDVPKDKREVYKAIKTPLIDFIIELLR